MSKKHKQVTKAPQGDTKSKTLKDPHANRPYVAVITPTYGRHKFLPWLIHIFNNQTYPQSRMVLIILDDCPLEVTDSRLLEMLKQDNIRYIRHTGSKMPIGAKRNMLNKLAIGAKADIIVCMDDDDFYPPERVEHCVTTLQRYKVGICGSSTMHIYFADDGIIRKFGPYGDFHATNGTFAFTRGFAETHLYDEIVAYGEETSFTGGFSEPLAQMDPFKTILCISHRRNTFDKSLIKASGSECKAKLKDFVKDKTLREFYAGLVKFQDENPEALPGVQQYAPLSSDGKIELD